MIGQATVRLVAVNLLLFAGLDLGVPSLCQAESALPLASHAGEGSLDNHDPEPAAPEPAHEEDCFCCCTHVRPRPITRGIEALTQIGEDPLVYLRLEPEQRATSLFHPPKP